MSQHPEQLDAWLLLMNTARNLERIADHAAGIAQTIVYLKEGVIIRHTPQPSPPNHDVRPGIVDNGYDQLILRGLAMRNFEALSCSFLWPSRVRGAVPPGPRCSRPSPGKRQHESNPDGFGGSRSGRG